MLPAGDPYEEYLGIPFAAPPVGPLRFEKPAPLPPWGDEVLNATSFSPSCIHLLAAIYPLGGFGAQTEEDCLYLNVWVPEGVAANESEALMFMVYFLRFPDSYLERIESCFRLCVCRVNYR